MASGASADRPEYDNILLSHDDRARVIPDRRTVPLPPGDGARAGTVLVDGDFRATWQLSAGRDSPVLTVQANPRLSPTDVGEVSAEGRRLLDLLSPDRPTEVRVLGPNGQER